ncbi:hypothetical protein ABZT04_09780 [Streptomyces sp. NPDC005492]|uniref:hypothetical protein n=1 Tax=Streptomyces sp. NPDC005492 TaxID=3156883 RepID=UPI0033AC6009
MRINWAGGGRVFGYARGRRALVAGSALACVLETLTLSVLLRYSPVLHQLVPFLGLFAVGAVAALHASSVARPHQLDRDALRLRRAVRADLVIPLGRIGSAEGESRTARRRADGELDLPVGFRTSVTLQLTEPVTHFTFVGGRRAVDTVRFHADDAERLVEALVEAVTRARTVPSPSPGRPG